RLRGRAGDHRSRQGGGGRGRRASRSGRLPAPARGRRRRGRRMNCGEADAFIRAYVDGELAGVDREGVERHLVACPTCGRRMQVEARFKAAVRAHLPRPEVPFQLRRRVQEVLASQPIAPRRWLTLPAWLSYPRLVPAAGAVLLL